MEIQGNLLVEFLTISTNIIPWLVLLTSPKSYFYTLHVCRLNISHHFLIEARCLKGLLFQVYCVQLKIP